MAQLETAHRPMITYRSIRPTDLGVLEKLHCDLFPIRYESEFFHNVVNGRDIVSWGAVDRNRPDGQYDELIGFATARVIMARESEVEDLLSFDASKSDRTLIYILTLGVVESYRNLGIASSMIREVVKYAANISSCRAVYLHVISYNNSAMHLYKKMGFQCVRRLHAFYFINGQHFDSYLFIYYVNGGRRRSPCSPLEFVTIMVTYIKSAFKVAIASVWKNEDRKLYRWLRGKESGGSGGGSSLLPTIQQNRKVVTAEGGGGKCQYYR